MFQPTAERGGAVDRRSHRRDSGPGKAIDSGTPAPVAAAAGAAFAALSSLRGAQIFHPDGVGFSGMLRVERALEGSAGVPLLERPAEHPALVRFSRGAGMPEPVPDVMRLTLRLPDIYGRGRHQDFLLVRSADAPVLRHLLLPAAGGFFGPPFSSILL